MAHGLRKDVPPKQHLADLKKIFIIKEIANLYQVSTRTAHLWMRIRELNDPKRDRIPPHEQKPLYDALMRGSITYADIARKYGLSENIARDYLIRFGPVPAIKKNHDPVLKVRHVPPQVRDTYIREYYLGLHDFEDLTEKLDIPLSAVKKLVRNHSITGFEKPTDDELEEVAHLSLAEQCEHFGEFDGDIVLGWYHDLNQSKRKRGVSA